ncbi:Hypothetical predicted protein [Lynx pardinus]|uniref:Uncharacterized protein n=1 Tax=Lynx pardinus TaxID=191816 RepID=A0A485PIY1_LYNPA|nr:Hypothetical predicted protein [Lynx pardinus]
MAQHVWGLPILAPPGGTKLPCLLGPLPWNPPALRASPALLADPSGPRSPGRTPLRAGRQLRKADLQPGKAARRSPEPDPARTWPPWAGTAGMSEARKGPDETDESQYDSGIESLRSLRSLPEPTPAPASGPSDSGGPQPWTHPPGTAKEPQEKEDTDGERADSTYGSSSLTEPLPLLGGTETEDPAPRSPLPAAGALSPQQLEALTYISEDGDTLVHLAVIHEAPAVLLCCLALLPQEVLDIQNNLYQVGGGERLGYAQIPISAPTAIPSSHTRVLGLRTQETISQTLGQKLMLHASKTRLCPQGAGAWARGLLSTPDFIAW